MQIIILVLFILNKVFGYRLLYLPYLNNNIHVPILKKTELFNNLSYDLNSINYEIKRIFIMNNNMNLTLSIATLENIKNMYVIVHYRTLYFYNNGTYFTFGLGEDGIRIVLVQVEIMADVEFFTQDLKQSKMGFRNWGKLVNNSNESKIIKKPEIVKFQKPPNIIKKTNNNETLNVRKYIQNKHLNDTINENNINNSIYSKPVIVMKPIENNSVEEEQIIVTKNSEKKNNKNEVKHFKMKDENINEDINENSTIVEKEVIPKKKTFNYKIFNKKNQINKKSIIFKDFIESDSNILTNTVLKIKIEENNKTNRTFFLKTKDDLCITHFEGQFILTKCTQSEHQIFKMEEARNVVNNIQPLVNNLIQNPVNITNDNILCHNGVCNSTNLHIINNELIKQNQINNSIIPSVSDVICHNGVCSPTISSLISNPVNISNKLANDHLLELKNTFLNPVYNNSSCENGVCDSTGFKNYHNKLNFEKNLRKEIGIGDGSNVDEDIEESADSLTRESTINSKKPISFIKNQTIQVDKEKKQHSLISEEDKSFIFDESKDDTIQKKNHLISKHTSVPNHLKNLSNNNLNSNNLSTINNLINEKSTTNRFPNLLDRIELLTD